MFRIACYSIINIRHFLLKISSYKQYSQETTPIFLRFNDSLAKITPQFTFHQFDTELGKSLGK